MTISLYQDSPMLQNMDATVLSCQKNQDQESGGTPDEAREKSTLVILDQTVFFAAGGGQPGDTGTLTWAGAAATVLNTRKTPAGIAHEITGTPPPVGTAVHGEVDWERRWAHMRLHTGMHLLCASVAGDVTGGQIAADKARLDFDIEESPDKQALTDQLNALVQADHPVTVQWEKDFATISHLVRTADKNPPQTDGGIRLVRIGSPDNPVDLQPCGGTHVSRTGEIGRLLVRKIENKGKRNRRITLILDEDA